MATQFINGTGRNHLQTEGRITCTASRSGSLSHQEQNHSRVTGLDRISTAFYIGRYKPSFMGKTSRGNKLMSENKPENVDLGVLEARVDDLIRTVDALKNENSALRHQQKNLISERAVLIEKTEQARFRIESMIARLRAMETRT